LQGVEPLDVVDHAGDALRRLPHGFITSQSTR
jgi:hypothetical protein